MNRHPDRPLTIAPFAIPMHRIARRCAAAFCGAAILLAAACATPPTAIAPKAAIIAELPPNSLAAAWRAELPLGTGRLKKLMADAQIVYAYSNDQRIFWINRGGGQMIAITNAGQAGDALYDIVPMSDRVIVPTSSQIDVFDRKGNLAYSLKLPYRPATSLTGDGKTVFFAMDNPGGARFLALPTKAQPYVLTPEWELLPPGEIVANPAAYQGTVYVATCQGAVIAIRADDRGSAWPLQQNGMFMTGGPILANLAADRDGLYVASGDTKLYCLDLSDGHVKWAYYAAQALGRECTPAPTANSVYFYQPGTGLVCIDKTVRQEIRKAKWIVEEARQFLASDANFDYLRSADNSIIAVDKASGQVMFRSKRNDYVVFATNANAKDGTIFAGTADGVILGIRPVLKPGTKGELALEAKPIELAQDR